MRTSMLAATTTAGEGGATCLADGATPPGLELILSALETGEHASADRRGINRRRYRVQARLRLFSDSEHAEPRILYTRNVHSRGLGFVSRERLPLGYGGRLEVPAPEGKILSLHCTLLRCRPAAPGWYEGALAFNREQADLEV